MRARNVYKKSMLKALRSNFRDISNELKIGTDESEDTQYQEKSSQKLLKGQNKKIL